MQGADTSEQETGQDVQGVVRSELASVEADHYL